VSTAHAKVVAVLNRKLPGADHDASYTRIARGAEHRILVAMLRA
jgi:hypothetical protein